VGIPVTQGVCPGLAYHALSGLKQKDNPDIQKSPAKHLAFTQNDEFLEAYEAHIKWKRDCNTGIAVAKSLRKGWVFL